MRIDIKNLEGSAVGEHEVGFEVISDGKGGQAVHDHVVAIRAGARRGTACTKTVGDVAGTNKKPWRQKGTGRARAGSFRSPLWRGGGVVHGPKPRDYSKKVNQRVKQLAFRRALSERLKSGDVIVVDSLSVATAKTKEFLSVMKKLGITRTGLFVVDVLEKNARLASRNIPGIKMRTGLNINTYDILKYRTLVFSKAGFQQIETRLVKKTRS